MNGTGAHTSGDISPTSGTSHLTYSPNEQLRTTLRAWERFAAGEDTVHGVRPEVLMSWYRCREQYQVDATLAQAPAAAEASAHSIEHDVVFAELGGLAAAATQQLGEFDGIATVTDSGGRVLASWGNRQALHRAASHNLAPWSTWSEQASGTNGMGTALESHRPFLVRGPEHWCQGFHSLVCAGVAVRNVVTRDPLAVLNISSWSTSLPDAALRWLQKSAAATEAKLRHQARHAGNELEAAYTSSAARPFGPLAALDLAGKVVIANNEAALLLGVPANIAAHDPAQRWSSDVGELPSLARYATRRVQQDPHWIGTTQLFAPFADTPVPVVAHPVFTAGHLIGMLLTLTSTDDTPAGLPAAESFPSPAYAPPPHLPSRIIARHGDKLMMLAPQEVRFAESAGNTVWLTTDQGQLQAATRGLDHLDEQLSPHGFLRVHRRFLINLRRVREIEQGFKGTLVLVLDTRPHETVPVARRRIPQLRHALGLSVLP